MSESSNTPSRKIVMQDLEAMERSAPAERMRADTVLLMWRRNLDLAIVDAKRTLHGLPTANALLARWWIEEHRPGRRDKNEWERSFECNCEWLDLDAAKERPRLIEMIERTWKQAAELSWRAEVRFRRAMVLTCAGVPVALAKQYVLPLVAETEWEDVAGVDHGDQYALYDRRTAA